MSQFIMQEAHLHADEFMFGNRSLRFDTPVCYGSVSTVQLQPNIALSLFDVVTYETVNFCVSQELPHIIELGIVLSGNINMRVAGSRREFDALPGQSYASVFAGNLAAETHIPANQHVQMLEMRFTPETLDEMCANLGTSVPSHLHKPLANAPSIPYKCSSVASQHMNQLAQEILSLNGEQTAQTFMLESISRDFVSRYLNFANNGSLPTNTTLTPRDIERVREARRILVARLENPPSLHELARLVNLNDFKLKLGFRQAFGTTAYRYLKQVRLQTAHHLLSERQGSVTEVALSVGYRNLGDFGIAFKQRYGMSPKAFRAGKKPLLP